MDIGNYLDERISKLTDAEIKEKIAFIDFLLKYKVFTESSDKRANVALKNRFKNHLRKRERNKP